MSENTIERSSQFIRKLAVNETTGLHVLDAERYNIAELCHVMGIRHPEMRAEDLKCAKRVISLGFHPDKVSASMAAYHPFFCAAYNRVKRAFDAYIRTNQAVTAPTAYLAEQVDYTDVVPDTEPEKADQHQWWRAPGGENEYQDRINQDSAVLGKSKLTYTSTFTGAEAVESIPQSQLVVRRSGKIRFEDKVVGDSDVMAIGEDDGYHSSYRLAASGSRLGSGASNLEYDDIRKVYCDKPMHYADYNRKAESQFIPSSSDRMSEYKSATWTMSSVPMSATVKLSRHQ